MDQFEQSARLPDATEQANNIIRYVGDHDRSVGLPVPTLPKWYYALVGAASPARAATLTLELVEKGLLRVNDLRRAQQGYIERVELTLAGWERYRAATEGQQPGTYGFLALKFGQQDLEGLVKNHLKPATKSIGYDLVDMRDAAQAGIIDNIMRMKIRDAAFVIVDLTHDNSGAYWEAGFAEGLSKPVLYICERNKFDSAKTHFDTNHLTTVLWEVGGEALFVEELVATLRNSLALLPDQKP